MNFLILFLILFFNSFPPIHCRRTGGPHDGWSSRIEKLENEVKILKQNYSTTATILRSFLDEPNVTFYSETGQQGNQENIQFNHQMSCYNLQNLGGRTKSFQFNKPSSCIRLYDLSNCEGSSRWLVPTGLLLKDNDKEEDEDLTSTLSVSPCFPTLYSRGYFNWLLHRARGMMDHEPIARGRTAGPTPSCTSQKCHYHLMNGCVCEDGCSGIFDYATFTCRVVRSSPSSSSYGDDEVRGTPETRRAQS